MILISMPSKLYLTSCCKRNHTDLLLALLMFGRDVKGINESASKTIIGVTQQNQTGVSHRRISRFRCVDGNRFSNVFIGKYQYETVSYDCTPILMFVQFNENNFPPPRMVINLFGRGHNWKPILGKFYLDLSMDLILQ